MTNKRKHQLQKELNDIAEKERQQIIKENYPAIKKKYEGQYFRVRNCYSMAEKKSDYWFLYHKVTAIRPEDVYDINGNGIAAHCEAYCFQTDKYGNISIENKKKTYVHILGKKISKNEFNAAWNKMVDKINIL